MVCILLLWESASEIEYQKRLFYRSGWGKQLAPTCPWADRPSEPVQAGPWLTRTLDPTITKTTMDGSVVNIMEVVHKTHGFSWPPKE